MKKQEMALATKKHIIDALKYYMCRKDFNKITVKDILEYADITRPTFYYHFEDIYGAMEWMFQEEMVSLLEQSRDCVTWDDGIYLVLKYVEENRAVCLCAYRSVGRDLLQRMFLEHAKKIMQVFIDTLLETIDADPEDVEFISDFYTMALANVLIRWLQKPEGRTPADVIRQIDVAMHGAIEAALLRSAERK